MISLLEYLVKWIVALVDLAVFGFVILLFLEYRIKREVQTSVRTVRKPPQAKIEPEVPDGSEYPGREFDSWIP